MKRHASKAGLPGEPWLAAGTLSAKNSGRLLIRLASGWSEGSIPSRGTPCSNWPPVWPTPGSWRHAWSASQGNVIVTDFTPEMVACGSPAGTGAGRAQREFRVLDAERMDLETDSVDGVLCRWAYMLMIDPPASFAQTRRVLRPGGRLAFSVWAARERNPALSLVGRVLVSQGHIPPPDPRAPGAFAMADPGRIRSWWVEAGFAEPEIEEVTFRWPFAEKDAYWHYVTETSSSSSPVLRALSPEVQSTVREQVHEAARPYRLARDTTFRPHASTP